MQSQPDPVLLLAAHARVSVATARKAIQYGAEAVCVRRAREDIVDAAAQLGIELGLARKRSGARGTP
jgi:hypothetical protein